MGVRRFNRRQYATPLPETLALDFIGRGDTLDPRITFSRASNATLINSTGAVAYAPHNLLTFSESFDNSVWVKFSGSVTANTSVAPDGTTTADTFVANGVSGLHRVQQTASAVASGGRSFSVYAKAGTNNFIQLLVDSDTAPWANFNLASGTIGSQGTNQTATIESVGNGWFRCTLFSNSANATSVNIAVITDGASVRAETNSLATTVLIWGAQLNVGALQPYNCTTVENALGFTQEFNNAAWSKTNSSITANATAAPDGSVTADKLVADATSNQHRVDVAITAVGGTPYTFSVYAKAGEYSFLSLRTGNGTYAAFNLSTGATSVASASVTATMVPVGDGWYRCSATEVITASGTMTSRINVTNSLSINNTQATFTGDGTSGLLIWGAQISDSASLDPYVYNPAAAFTSTAYYGPRFDYDPVTLAPRGLLIEEQRTNLLLQSADLFENGTGGVNWIWPVGVVSSNTQTAPDGTLSADTITTTGGAQSAYQSATVTASTAYTFSFYAKLGTMLASDFKIAVYNNSTPGFIASDVVPTQTPTTTGWTRITYTFTTPVGCTSVRVYPFRNSLGISSSTVFIWGAQLEAGAFVTSYIPTTTAAATRAADVATMVGDNFSNWYNQSEGTLFAEAANIPSNYTSGVLMDVGFAGAFGTSAYVACTGTGWSLNPNIAPLNLSSAVSTTLPSKVGAALAANNSVIAANGALGPVDTSCALPAGATILSIGKAGWNTSNYLNGHIRRIAYYPRRLPDDQLRGITV